MQLSDKLTSIMEKLESWKSLQRQNSLEIQKLESDRDIDQKRFFE